MSLFPPPWDMHTDQNDLRAEKDGTTGPIALALVVLVFGAPSAPGAVLVPGVGAAHAYGSFFGCNTGYVGNFGMFDPSVESTWGFGSTSTTDTLRQVPERSDAALVLAA